MKKEEDQKIVSGLTINYNQPDTNPTLFSNQEWKVAPSEGIEFDEDLQHKRQEYLNDLNERRK